MSGGPSRHRDRVTGGLRGFRERGGFFAEQVWNVADVPERELVRGQPSGSAMPLVWAHAEYLKLRRSVQDTGVFDMPPQTRQRYVIDKTTSPHAVWRFNHKMRTFPAGKVLRIEALAPAVLHWSRDNWATVYDTEAEDTRLGVYVVDLPTAALPAGCAIVFTFYWPEAHRWEGADFTARIE